jgi:hypothetical protein
MEQRPITTVEMNVRLAEGMIENHINNMHHAEKCLVNRHLLDEMIWENFEDMIWCCEHSPVEGTIDISFLASTGNDVRHLSIPVFTNFGVVCTKEKEKSYKITWSYSLS